MTFDAGAFSVSTWRLFRRHVHVGWGSVSNLDVRVRRRLDVAQVPADEADFFPLIEGLSNPPVRKPEVL